MSASFLTSRPSRRAIMVALAVAPMAACGRAPLVAKPEGDLRPLEKALDVPYVPTPTPVVEAMLDLAKPAGGERLIDLGCGDGRIVIAAALRAPGLTGLGVDIDPERIGEARAAANAAGVSDRVQFLQQDLFETDIADADVLTLYLLPQINLRLRPVIFAALRPGARVVSHDFDMGDWTPEATTEVPGDGSKVFLWIVPAALGGTWESPAGHTLRLTQTFQTLEGDGVDAIGPFTATGRVEGARATLDIARRNGQPGTASLELSGPALSGQWAGGAVSFAALARTPTRVETSGHALPAELVSP